VRKIVARRSPSLKTGRAATFWSMAIALVHTLFESNLIDALR
jgi:hypothetical protein